MLPLLPHPNQRQNLQRKMVSKQLVTRTVLTTHFIAIIASDSPSQSIKPRSSCAANTILTGANYLKGQPPVVALEDDAYPEWLWDTLMPKVYDDDGPGGKKERVERRRATQQAIKDRNFMQTQ
ncbi:hypothetical protein M413DRAFT_264940 [Hebeloma cylindrosporum]|uniref:Large ribosomal subunit protein mL54 n=1 Tax=Hebeloma cylindrosporum TaxID=76867 RepID=A0A0C3CDN2_HEBCY|nr:hypothetical protein M413DRAFT_264940 [Hebeloma cylindrosporum h7]